MEGTNTSGARTDDVDEALAGRKNNKSSARAGISVSNTKLVKVDRAEIDEQEALEFRVFSRKFAASSDAMRLFLIKLFLRAFNF